LIEQVKTRENPASGYSSKAATGMVGLENLGATCYLNALLQMLYNVNLFRKNVYKLPTEGEVFENSTTLALQSVFRNLQCAKFNVTTKDLTRAFGWTSQEAFMQQDVQEMMRVLLDKLEEKMKGTDVEGTTLVIQQIQILLSL
jgi:ubiquitin carboxyl-terminal hydrolase 7